MRGFLRPTISVITVTLNCERSIGRLMQSLLSQTDTDFDWIVVDGGSVDGTVKLARQFPPDRLRLISEPDFGIYHALNKAIKLATGEYYLVIGSDDEFDPKAIESFRLVARETNADIVAASVKVRGQTVTALKGAPWLRGGNAYVSSHAVGTLIRRDLHARCGYYSNRYVNAADMLFVRAAARQGARIARGDFVAGVFSSEGISTADRICSITEAYRVQMSFGENMVVQLGLLIMRIVRSSFTSHRRQCESRVASRAAAGR